MPLIPVLESPLSTRIWNVLRTLNLTTREQVIAAYEDGTLVRAGLGAKSLAELRRALGLDPSLTTTSLPSRCPKCGGESGFRAKVVRTEVRLYTWADVLESTPEVRHQSNTRIECRDCDGRLPMRYRVDAGG